jgi:hypothetical protein
MRRTRSLFALAALALAANTASAQVGTLSNGPVTVVLNATQNSTLALSTSAASTSIASINAGTTTDFPSLNVTAAWNLTSGANIVLVGWFATPAAALTGPGGNIAAARVLGKTGVAAFQPFTGAPVAGQGVGGGTAQLWSVAATPLNSTATTNLDIRLDYTGQLPPNAGLYTGTLNLRAVVQ